MIMKRIDNISTDVYPYVMGNIAKSHRIVAQTHNSITAEAEAEAWAAVSLPTSVTVVEL